MSDIKFAKIECTDPTHSVHGKSVEWHPRYGVGTVISFDSGRKYHPYQVQVVEVNGYTIKCKAMSTDPWGLWTLYQDVVKVVERRVSRDHDVSPAEWQTILAKAEKKLGISKTRPISQKQIDEFNSLFQGVISLFRKGKSDKCEEKQAPYDSLEELGVIYEDSNFEEKAEADYSSLRGEKHAPRLEVGHGFALKAAQTAWDLLEANKELEASRNRETKLKLALHEAKTELRELRKMVE